MPPWAEESGFTARGMESALKLHTTNGSFGTTTEAMADEAEAERSELFRMPFTVGSYPNTFKSQCSWIAEAWHRTKTNSRHTKNNSGSLLTFWGLPTTLLTCDQLREGLNSDLAKQLSIFTSQSMLTFTPLFEENINNDNYAQVFTISHCRTIHV